MARRRNRPIVLALAAALLLGVAGRVLLSAVRASPELPHAGTLTAVGESLVALGAPWLAAAWLVGALSGSRRAAPFAGAAALVLGTGAWYGLTILTQGRYHALHYALPVGIGWACVAFAAGALFGAAGAAWRYGGAIARAAGVATLAGALAGGAVALGGQWTGRAAAFGLTVELAVAGAVPVLAARPRRALPLAVALTAVAAVGIAFAEDAVRDALRLTGWSGP